MIDAQKVPWEVLRMAELRLGVLTDTRVGDPPFGEADMSPIT